MSKHIQIRLRTDEVQAILEDRKTQIRRVMKHDKVNVTDPPFAPDWDYVRFYDGHAKFCEVNHHINETYVKCPYGHPDDVLWVRESWQHHKEDKNDIIYRASVPSAPQKYIYWKPSIHMPKSACRLFLKVKSVRVERLQDISPEDVTQEGVKYTVRDKGDGTAVAMMRISGEHNAYEFLPKNHKELSPDELHNALLKATFAELWCDINGYDSYIANPWVWVVEFEQCPMPAGFLN